MVARCGRLRRAASAAAASALSRAVPRPSAHAALAAAAAGASSQAPRAQAPSADAQFALLEHCARGLRSALESSAAGRAADVGVPADARSTAAAALPAVAALLAGRPEATRAHRRFYCSPHLGFAFEMEAVGALQAQALPALGELVALAISCAEAGMVPYSLPARIARAAGVQSAFLAPPPPAAAAEVTPWTMHATPQLAERVAEAAKELAPGGRGWAVVPGILGDTQAAAVRGALTAHFAAREGQGAGGVVAGQMEREGAADRAQRDDDVLWLLGDERDRADAPDGGPAAAVPPSDGGIVAPGGTLAAAMTQLVRGPVLEAVRQGAGAALPLREPTEYVSRAMLARYSAGARGFVRHLDASFGGRSAQDERLVSAVYYATPTDWGDEFADGGELVLFPPGASEPVVLKPEADSLVLFRSREVEHEVRPTRRDRLALSFWYLAASAEQEQES